MIVSDEWFLHQGSPFRIPLERYHISEIIRRGANSVTGREVNQKSAAFLKVFRMEKVPQMRVAMNKSVSFNRSKTPHKERRRKLHRLFISSPPIRRESVAQVVNATGKIFPYLRYYFCQSFRIKYLPYLCAQ